MEGSGNKMQLERLGQPVPDTWRVQVSFAAARRVALDS
jgi:hypothetical protein